MFYIYSDTGDVVTKRRYFSGIGEADPVEQYMKHFENGLYLSFVALNSDNAIEKLQVNKELKICDRKKEYWKRFIHSKEDYKRLTNLCEQSKRKWL